MKYCKPFLFIFLPFLGIAQNNDSIDLEEVFITSDLSAERYHNARFTQVLNDSILKSNYKNFTDLLNRETLIYFKEQGLGMVSSPSFRGSTASQTAVIWNGINLNSLLLGQSDFNVINPYSADQILVTAGGNSLAYGSGAISGSVQLNNQFRFQNKFENQIQLSYGSFGTIGTRYETNYANDRLNLKFSYGRNQSDNDYKLPENRGKNLNGKYYNNSYDFAGATKLNANHILKFYSSLNDVNRNFSLILSNETPTKYKDFNTRSMLEWNYHKNRWTSNTKVAFVSEQYQYFSNKYSDLHTEGKSSNLIGKYDLMYQFDDRKSLNIIAEYNHQVGEGDEINKTTRNIVGGTLWWKHRINNKLVYDISLRQDYTEIYDNPFLYALGIQYRVADFYTIRFNGSKNFRIPTYNDLFWNGSGNPDLIPETSHQAEIGNDFKLKDFNFNLNFYYNRIKDMIQWSPVNGMLWKPQNIGNVESYGLEFFGKWDKYLGGNHLSISAMYAYNESKNKDTNKYLIYTPRNKANFNFAYSYKRYGLDYFLRFVDEVHTTSDNLARYDLDSYTISDLNFHYSIDSKNRYRITFGIRNLFNQKYQVVESRYMPGTNYYFNINIKF